MTDALGIRSLKKRLHWVDFLLIAVLGAFFLYVWLQIEGKLNYIWRWEQIPNYLFFYDERTERWTANVLIQGLITTIRISVYASILALVLGVILGVARTLTNLTVRMLARTLPGVPAQHSASGRHIHLLFLPLRAAHRGAEHRGLGLSSGRQEDNGVWEFFFGDMRRFPSLISGVIVLALFERRSSARLSAPESNPSAGDNVKRPVPSEWAGSTKPVSSSCPRRSERFCRRSPTSSFR